jgi:hypothetical protein
MNWKNWHFDGGQIAKTHICGYCSREFATSRSVCVCGNEPGKSQTGMFWEGGEGTRNKNTMNRKVKSVSFLLISLARLQRTSF